MKNLKELKWYWWVFILLIVFLILRSTGKLDNYLPFFLTSDGWNKNEREMNMDHTEMEMKKGNDHDIHHALIVGGGNEPGWNFEIHATSTSQKKVHIDLVTDYGEKEFLGYLYKSELTPLQYRGKVIGGGSQELKREDSVKDIIISFENKVCTDDADKKHSLAVELSFNGENIWKGCGDMQ